MAAKRLALLTVTILAACGGGDRESMAADSLSRDLQLLPADSSAALDDRAPAAPTKPVATRPKPKPAPSPKVLAGGTVIPTVADREINSRANKAGEILVTTVSADVTDSRGRVVIPAGAKVKLTITEIHESENKRDKTGKLTLTPTEVAINGRSYALYASAEAMERHLRDRKTNAGDIAKVGAGTAAGAVVGRVVGGNTKGAIIGGVIGGAIGTQRAIETQDRDVVVPAGSRIELTLQGSLTI
jgi:type IV secretory pathway VirB10-like protein